MLVFKRIHGCILLVLCSAIPVIAHALPIAKPVIAFGLPLVKPEQQAPAQKATPGQKSLIAGYAALLRNELDAAAAAFTESAKLDGKSPLPLIGMAEIARRQNNQDLAESWLKKALTLAPKSADAQRAWARYLIGQHKGLDAEAALTKAIKFEPKSADSYVDLGGVYLRELNRPKDASRVYREAIKLQESNAEAHLGLGSALAMLGGSTAAATEFELAAKFSPKNPLPLYELGRLYAAERKYDLALAEMDKALLLQPGYDAARLGRGDIFVARGSLDRALAEYLAVAKDTPSLAIAHLKVGAIYQSQRKWGEAKQAFLRAVEADPLMYAAYNNLAWMAAERKEDLDNALLWAKKTVEIAPDASDSLDTLAWVHRARGELDQAAVVLEKAVVKQPKRPDFFYHLGLVYAEKGRRKEASTAFNKALEIGKDFPEAKDTRLQLDKLGKK